MITYQDLLNVGEDETARMDFVRRVINEHKTSDLYITAVIAQEYAKKKNVTILQYKKTITTISGKEIEDEYSPNHKVVSGFFKRFTTQQVQYLLGNGATFDKKKVKNKLGKNFDTILQRVARQALIGGVAYGFWNLDHLELFKVTEFAPLLDEENGSLRAGVRWWQIDTSKPLRATLYEEDGYTDYVWDSNGDDAPGRVLAEKRKYISNVSNTPIDGTEIMEGENYPSFPIVPFWGNEEHQSELVGIRDGIDAYDLIKNGFENDLDNAQMYWIIKHAGGMDDPDLAKFLERLKKHKIAAPADDQDVEAHTVEIPHEAREKLLDRIKRDLYDDYMALDVKEIASGAATATQIRAAYEPMNSKSIDFEYCVIDFVSAIMELAGLEGNPTFTRSMIVNTQEEVTTVLSAASYLPKDYVTKKVLTILGDGDQAEAILNQMADDELSRASEIDDEDEDADDEDGIDDDNDEGMSA